MSGPSSTFRRLAALLVFLPVAGLALLVSCTDDDDVTGPDPNEATIVINGGAEYTVFTSVALSVDAPEAAEVRFSNTADFAGAIWEDVSEVREDWQLEPGEGERTVYAEFRDQQGGTAGSAQDDIQLVDAPPGHPAVTLLYLPNDGSDPVELEDGDYVPYSSVVSFSWSATTPAATDLPPEVVAALDSVPPLDGILGYRYRIGLEDCDEDIEDCYRPRFFDEASGDSVSYYGMVTTLDLVLADYAKVLRKARLGDDGVEDDSDARQLTPLLYIDAVDIAGATIPLEERDWNVLVNLPPETEMIVGLDPDYPDPQEYPYWELLTGPFAGTREHFTAGERIPDRAYVVFKARGRDDPRDEPLDPEDFGVDIQGNFTALGLYDGSTPFTFSPQYSEPHRTPEWVAQTEGGWTADTLGFLVGPFEYTMRLRAVDEHGRRDSEPPDFEFEANFPPCVQCVELLNDTDVENIGWDDPCDIAACFADTARYFTSHLGGPNPERNYLSFGTPLIGGIWYKISTGEIFFDEPTAPETFDFVPAYYFTIRIALHGKETNDYERTSDTSERIMAWSYQMDYENDAFNQIQDGEPLGIDRLGSFTESFSLTDPRTSSVFIDSQGVWFVRVRVVVPLLLQTQGPTFYFNTLLATYGNDPDAARAAWDLTTKQIGYGQIQAQATDQPTCGGGDRTTGGKYWYFDGVRVPLNHPDRACHNSADPAWHDVRLENFRAYSETKTLLFRFAVQTGTEGDYYGGPPPR